MQKLLFLKKVDKSLLGDGLTLPNQVAEEIMKTWGITLLQGQKCSILLEMAGIECVAVFSHVNQISGRDVYQIRYGKKSAVCQRLIKQYVSPENAKANNSHVEVWISEKKIFFIPSNNLLDLGEIKKSFYEYLGPVDSLYGYQKSYKLVFYHCFFSEALYEKCISAERLTKQFRQFYIDRKRFGMLPEMKGADEIVQQPEKSSVEEFYRLILRNPFEAVSKKRFFSRRVINGEEYFSIDDQLFNALNASDLEEIRNTVSAKLLLYYDSENKNDKKTVKEEIKAIVKSSSGTLRDALIRLTEGYAIEKKNPIGGNPLAHFIVHGLPETVYQTGVINKNDYMVSASAGIGAWASVPWLCILNKQVTETPREGVYIVYLLSKDTKRLYLTLNQGCMHLRKEKTKKETIQIMRNTAHSVSTKISPSGFIFGYDIQLGNQLSELATLYKEGCIFYKEYMTGNLPDERTLIGDLQELVNAYAEYVHPSPTVYPTEPAWLLTWNPECWNWNDYAAGIEASRFGDKYETVWSCANTHIKPGDRVYLMILGKTGVRGLIASGTATSNVFQTPHWDHIKAVKGKTINSIRVSFDKILDFRSDPILDIKVLQEKCPDQKWDPQSSGIEINQQYVTLLDDQWKHYINKTTGGNINSWLNIFDDLTKE